MILMIDNYDSFTFNLVQYIGELGADPVVRRNDAIDVAGARALKPRGIIISPGPRRPEDVRGTVVTVHAVHQAPRSPLPILRRIIAGRQVGANAAVRSGQLDLVNRLPRGIGAVADGHARIDMPVDALGLSALQAADPHHQYGFQLGVGAVVGMGRGDLQPVADELVRPMALLAGLPRGAQVLDRRQYGAGVEVEVDGDDLPGPGQLGLDEPVRTGTDVARRALDPRVRRPLVGRVLGRHHTVASGAAELRGVHVFQWRQSPENLR